MAERRHPSYTSHGHLLPDRIPAPPLARPPVARCGGPGLCTQCSQEAAVALLGPFGRPTQTSKSGPVDPVSVAKDELACARCGITFDDDKVATFTALSWTQHVEVEHECECFGLEDGHAPGCPGGSVARHWWTLDCPTHGTVGVRFDDGELDLGIIRAEAEREESWILVAHLGVWTKDGRKIHAVDTERRKPVPVLALDERAEGAGVWKTEVIGHVREWEARDDGTELWALVVWRSPLDRQRTEALTVDLVDTDTKVDEELMVMSGTVAGLFAVPLADWPWPDLPPRMEPADPIKFEENTDD